MAPARKEPDKTTYSGRFAVRLRMLREKAGLTAQEVGDLAGVSYKTVYAWEASTNAPHVSAYPILAEIYKLKKVRDLLPNE